MARFPTHDPTPAQIRQARKAANHTCAQAASILMLGAPVRWTEYETGTRKMRNVKWEWYLVMTGQHPEWKALRLRKQKPARKTARRSVR